LDKQLILRFSLSVLKCPQLRTSNDYRDLYINIPLIDLELCQGCCYSMQPQLLDILALVYVRTCCGLWGVRTGPTLAIQAGTMTLFVGGSGGRARESSGLFGRSRRAADAASIWAGDLAIWRPSRLDPHITWRGCYRVCCVVAYNVACYNVI